MVKLACRLSACAIALAVIAVAVAPVNSVADDASIASHAMSQRYSDPQPSGDGYAIYSPDLGNDGQAIYEVKGEASVSLVEIYKVILPTSEVMGFVLDPLGIAGIAAGESAPIAALDTGKVFPKTNMPASILNESSVPIALTIDIWAHSTAGGGGNADSASFVQFDTDFEITKYGVFEGNRNNVLLYAVPSRYGINTAYDAYSPAEIGFVITESPVRMSFDLPAAEYRPVGSGDNRIWQPVDGTGNGIQIQVGGYVNNNADWLNFTEEHIGDAASKIGLTIVFNWSVIVDDHNNSSPFAGVEHLQAPMSRSSPGYVMLDATSLETLTSHPAIAEIPRPAITIMQSYAQLPDSSPPP